MDKVAPKSDMFKANGDRVAPLLAKLTAWLNSENVRHLPTSLAKGPHKIQCLGIPSS